jgi:hypothetical protein
MYFPIGIIPAVAQAEHMKAEMITDLACQEIG